MAINSMSKASKPSKVVKPKKGSRKSTLSTKNHRFQSFSERIAKLKIDPIRRRRGAEGREHLSNQTETYFGRSLGEWQDVNLSQTFTAFAREALPLCDNLPVVLHNEEKIMNLLVSYIDKGDALAMEPLLNLLSHFAHDLDIQFEKHFERAVATITAVVGRHSDPAVIEWTFTCLTWLFKYLSRLLAPDLRALYNLMSPYLGKQVQKPFIIRFAAESMSFLIRKAAATYERDVQPLDLIVEHVVEDCVRSSGKGSADLHQQGTMTMLTESMTGVYGEIHSTAPSILRSILKASVQRHPGDTNAMLSAVQGIITSVIHHTSADTFKPLLNVIVEHVMSNEQRDRSNLQLSCSLLFTMASVRKGSRISEWKLIEMAIESIVEKLGLLPDLDGQTAHAVLSTIAVFLQSATVDAVFSASHLIGITRKGFLSMFFLHFCDLTARLDAERFHSFVLPELQNFTSEQWEERLDELLLLLPKIVARCPNVSLHCPAKLQDTIIDRVNAMANSGHHNHLDPGQLAWANMALAATPYLKLSLAHQQQLRSNLRRTFRESLESDAASDDERAFTVGRGFAELLDLSGVEIDVWPLIAKASGESFTLPWFWNNVQRLLQNNPTLSHGLEGPHVAMLEDALISSLALPSHSIRIDALKILQQLYRMKGKEDSDVLSTAIVIESAPLSLETSRFISMNIRRLASAYANLGSDPLLQRAILTYCFGVLHIQLAQAWEDAVNVLADICKEASGEEVVMSLAQQWLSKASELEADTQRTTIVDAASQGFKVASDFECPNLTKLDSVAKQVFESRNSGYLSAEEQFKFDYQRVPMIPNTARAQALRVLSKISHIAEKRSRLLVPVLLRWAGAPDTGHGDAGVSTDRWSRKDQKAMLAIFAQFTNPKVLYRSAEVYNALLNLCANGDIEIQRSALKAILAWKVSAVNRYEEHLFNLLDEARFREELSVFLHSAENEDGIKQEDQLLLMPVLLRLLYGRTVAGKHEQASRRKALFIALSRFNQIVLGTFVDIVLSRVAMERQETSQDSIESLGLDIKASLRQELGMLNMVHDILDTLSADMEAFVPRMMHVVLRCLVTATKQLESVVVVDDLEDASMLRSVRQVGMQCLALCFAAARGTDLSREANIILSQLVQPRLDRFALENAQSVSGLLRLFATWSASPASALHLNGCNDMILECVANFLRMPTAKDEVKLFVLQELLENLLHTGSGEAVLQSHVTSFAQSIGYLLKQQPSKDVLDASITSLTSLAGLISGADEVRVILEVCTDLLVKPTMLVSSSTKLGLLRMMLPLLDHAAGPFDNQLYEAVCGLFSRLHDQVARTIGAEVLEKLCRFNSELVLVAEICRELNATSSRLGEADHERRDKGFAKIYEQSRILSPQQWLPVVHNCLYYMRDPDDLVNRSSASQALERFVDSIGNTRDGGSMAVLSKVLQPAIERSMQEPSELVRAEYLRLLGVIVEKLPDWTAVSDMQGLTVGGDDEAAIFNNVLHIQQHRRLRALRRLADEAPHLGSNSVSRFFLPLLEHFVFNPIDGDAGRTLADQTITTIGTLARALNWSAFRSIFNRYTGYISSKEGLEKTVLRLLGGLVDSLSKSQTNGNRQRSETIVRDFLPPLMGYLHHRDESTVDRRMPVAVTVVKLLQLLSEEEMSSKLAPVLTDVCHVLRSRSQEARDQTRKALASILSLIGPAYLGFILKELRSALQRGYQLHVLSYTVHSLLVSATDACNPGDLDHCLTELTSIIMDDIFGITGQEKDAEEYKSGMKEVKSSKSFDTMELLARVTPITRLGRLIQPVRALLTQNLDAKMVKKVDDILIRLRKGLDQTPAAESRDMLIFCHEIVRQVYAEQNVTSSNGKIQDYKVRKYLIQMEASNKSRTKGATTSQVFKLSSFAFNLVRKVIRRHEDLQTPVNMAGFLPMAGDAIVRGQEEVKVAAMKLLASIVRLPIPELETNATLYLKEAVALIKASSASTTDAAKAALELVTAVLREKRSVAINEADVAYLLKVLKPDIDEPDRQGVIYKFLRAVLGRKIVIAEIYETMDEVGRVMVTSPDRHIRESARSAFLQFILEYSQGKERWNKQVSFLVENLKYEHPGGRQSVVELLHQLLPRLGAEVLDKLGFTFFVALVPVQVGDVDAACRQMAGILLGKLFERAGHEQSKSYLTLMNKWLGNGGKPTIQVAALQCWSIYLRICQGSNKQVAGLQDRIVDFFQDEDVQVGLQVLKAILQTLSVMVEANPETAFAHPAAVIWSNVQQCVSAADLDIQELAASLVASYFSHLASSSANIGAGMATVPLRGSYGLEMNAEEMRSACRTSLRLLMSRSHDMSEALATQTVRNLGFLGRCFAANGMPMRPPNNDVIDDEGDSLGEDEEEVDETAAHQDPSALAYLLNRLSYIIRQDSLSTTARAAALQCQATLLNHLPSASMPHLPSLLRPLYTLTDPSIPQPHSTAHRDLADQAREVLDSVQKKVGTEAYLPALGEARKVAREKREERRQKRKIEAVSAPERWAREKKRKREAMKVKKKAKGLEARGKRRGW